jgi:hypothetical protein
MDELIARVACSDLLLATMVSVHACNVMLRFPSLCHERLPTLALCALAVFLAVGSVVFAAVAIYDQPMTLGRWLALPSVPAWSVFWLFWTRRQSSCEQAVLLDIEAQMRRDHKETRSKVV